MSKFELPTDPKIANKVIAENAKMENVKAQLGWLGRFFGNSSNVRLYIVGLIALVLLLIGIIYTFIPQQFRSETFGIGELWSVLTPMLTTIVGYLIGSNDKKEKEIIE